MRHGIRALVGSIAATLLAVSITANAATTGPDSADMAAIKNFRLTTAFLHKWEAYEAEAAQHPCELSPKLAMNSSGNGPKTLKQAAAMFDAQPGVHAALAKAGFTAREALLGMSTLMAATMQEMMAHYPAMSHAAKMPHLPAVSAANMAFYRQHKEELRRYQMKIGREEIARNHGQMPTCLMGAR